MKQKRYQFLQAIVALSFASFACQSLRGETPTATQESELEILEPPSTEVWSQPTGQPLTDHSEGTGMLCVGSRTGLSCLNESGWQLYTEENSDLPDNYLSVGAVCPNGQIAIVHSDGVVLFDGKTFTSLPATNSYLSPNGAACDENGAVWIAHFQGVSRYSNGKWTTYRSDQLASGDSANKLVYDVKAAPDGKVWVVTSQSVAMFENETWTVFQEGHGFDGSRFFNALTVDAKGRPWAAHSAGIDVFENSAWISISIDKRDYSSSESIAVDAQGQVWLGTLSDGAFRFDGSSTMQHDRQTEQLLSNTVTSLAADRRGRVWLGTTYGLTVFDGASWQTFLMSNSGLGDNDVKFVLVTKDGPALSTLEEKARASLTGKIEKADGTPLADATVEICVEILATSFTGDTPCSDQPFFLSTQTDANGVFILENVPASYYVTVVNTGEGWTQLADQFGILSERTLIQAGEEHDMRTLTLEE